MTEFVVALDAVNRIAEHSAGFVWRLRSSESHGATTLPDGSHQLMVNLRRRFDPDGRPSRQPT